ncbi:uncharacterized protein LOC108743232 [Agrilus planipennis]|uniref:Uncharacterized protein LOC108743232 n=1 Tax=Agrilus planipennis TaxID=224129 RepID=A0A7F5R4E1_AGRPL|nr:uncharacterized protein LOC108743232 [Agrilus planipennis]
MRSPGILALFVFISISLMYYGVECRGVEDGGVFLSDRLQPNKEAFQRTFTELVEGARVALENRSIFSFIGLLIRIIPYIALIALNVFLNNYTEMIKYSLKVIEVAWEFLT